jgi:1-acyl-sn-glycerol-3-phosphate acyltransferase
MRIIDERVTVGLKVAAKSLRVCVPTVLESMVGRVRREVCDARIAWWSRQLLDDVAVTLDVRGLEHFEGLGASIVMSNHQSHYDVPVLYQVLPGTVRMLAKRELFRIPIFGRAMRAAEFVEVDRGNRRRAVASLRVARTLIEQGVSVWIAPEGTRSTDGTLLPFKKGGFVLAEQVDAPIVPVSIHGTCRILPARTTHIRLGQRVVVTVHPAVVPDTRARENTMKRVREAIASGLR